ncbi:patatin-like phospholipase family protein [Arthrobacter sp. zg-Y820]|uniref:patatin-like phospholipase family protein n=1 Tax=unclassified Arthrobacter TaxID=235627 RepID=UPI001E5CC4FA|nr:MULTISPECIES: patatin-like phospholipase family protein [unclassified Arthrobacter]MCC9195627.1 patatin-like phospholipase family protein [Arthrobacter sp. zg-Y820]MDK1278486.1 patatin-like phospholipase family protein [Arthrobacter sp. zg.Y820]WIB09078.1 patatin-like phospholipase family protein [Arthrobacter sp. zg-Y820]
MAAGEAGNTGRALVLGGGGLSGIGWEIGLLLGLAERGVDLTAADVVIGTSAGSVVGARLRSGVALEDAYRRQLEPPGSEIPAVLNLRSIVLLVGPKLLGGSDAAVGRRIGRSALRSRTVDPDVRRAVIEKRIGSGGWPERPLLITAIDAVSGERRVWNRSSGVSLVDAVSASCAVPTVWPAIPIAGRKYIDGGSVSSTNADLAAGAAAVVAVAPVAQAVRRRWGIHAELAALGSGTRRVALTPDRAAAATMGRHSLDPAWRAAAARAGYAAAAAEAGRIREVWA